jgi:Ca-activated chloride channel family protein
LDCLFPSGVVCTIGLLYDSETREYRQALQTLSDDTGGLAYFQRSLDEVNEIASEVAQDIHNQYTVGYHLSGLPASVDIAWSTSKPSPPGTASSR